MTSCRSVKESAAAAAAAKETHIPPVLQSLRLTGRTTTLTPQRNEAPIQTQRIRPPETHEIPGQSRRKHMDSSVSLAKDGSTKKMKEERASKKHGDDALKDERTMRGHARPTALHKTDSVRRGVQSRNKSSLTKLVGRPLQKKLQAPHDNHVAGRKKDRDEQGDSRTAASMHQKQLQQRPSMKREGGTEQRKKVGTTLESRRSISHGRTRMSYSHKKLPPRGTVEFQSQTSSSYKITESMDESASGTSNSSSTSLSQRTSEQPCMRKKSQIHKAQRKYYSSSSSSSSPRPASSLRPRPRVVREESAKKRRGRLRRFKDKLAVIFHHHYHRGSSGADSEVESPTHRRGSMRKPSGAGAAAIAVIRAPRRRHRHHGHLYTLLRRLLRHVRHSRMEEEKAGERGDEMGKKSSRLVGMGRNCWWVQGAAGGGGVKLGSRKKKPPLGLGFSKAQSNKTQVS